MKYIVSHASHTISSSDCSLFFLLVSLPPPRSPLFPYTTLFRSREVNLLLLMLLMSMLSVPLAYDPSIAFQSFKDFSKFAIIFIVLERNTDRKSTRPELQSLRHLVCRLLLEKKNKQKNEIHSLSCFSYHLLF